MGERVEWRGDGLGLGAAREPLEWLDTSTRRGMAWERWRVV